MALPEIEEKQSNAALDSWIWVERFLQMGFRNSEPAAGKDASLRASVGEELKPVLVCVMRNTLSRNEVAVWY